MKTMTIIIKEMIDVVRKQGREPKEIRLTDRDYWLLFSDFCLFNHIGYKIVLNGVVYSPQENLKAINYFMDIPIIIANQTIVVWQGE